MKTPYALLSAATIICMASCGGKLAGNQDAEDDSASASRPADKIVTLELNYSALSKDRILSLATTFSCDYEWDDNMYINGDTLTHLLEAEVCGIHPVSQYYDGRDLYQLSKIWLAYMTDQYEAYSGLTDIELKDVFKYQTEAERYADGERKFPIAEVRKVFAHPLYEYGDYDNHGGYPFRNILALQFLAEELFAPLKAINEVCDICSDDNRVGIFKLKDGYNTYYDVSIIFFAPETGQISLNLFSNGIEHNHQDKVFHIAQDGLDYYLLYDSTSLYHLKCRLFLYNNGTFTEVEIANADMILSEDLELRTDVRQTYNPREHRWNVCTFDGEFYQPIPGTNTLRLKIEGTKAELVKE